MKLSTQVFIKKDSEVLLLELFSIVIQDKKLDDIKIRHPRNLVFLALSVIPFKLKKYMLDFLL